MEMSYTVVHDLLLLTRYDRRRQRPTSTSLPSSFADAWRCP